MVFVMEIDKNDAKLNRSDTAHLSLEDIVHITNKIGMEYVEAKKELEIIELHKHTNRAIAMEKYDDGTKTEAKIRRLAEMDDKYIECLNGIVQAKHNMEKLKLRYESYKNLFEAKRSMLSYQKAEMRLL